MVKLGRGKASDYDALARRAQYWRRLQERLGDHDLEDYLQEHSISAEEHSQLLKELAREEEASAPEAELALDLFA